MRTLTFTLLLVLVNTIAFATQEKKTAKIRITGPGGFPDETTIYFDFGVSPVYSSPEDGPKAYSHIPNAPSLYSMTTDNVFCSTNGYSPLTLSAIVPLGVKTDTAGLYVFSASILTNFDSTSIIQLEDRQQNSLTDLRVQHYAVLLADSENINDRFFLHVSRAASFAADTAGCANNDGSIRVDQDNTIQWSGAWLYDSLGTLIDSLTNMSGPYSFIGLAEGPYSLQIKYGDYTTTKTQVVPGSYVIAHIQPSTLTATVNQEITFVTTSHNATNFKWELGDSTQITGVANPSYSYLAPGHYEVILSASDVAGCFYRDSAWVEISAVSGIAAVRAEPRKIWAYDKTVTVVLDEELGQGAELKIYNVLGQPVYYNPITDLTTEITLNDVAPGYYIVSLQNNKVESAKRVFLGK